MSEAQTKLQAIVRQQQAQAVIDRERQKYLANPSRTAKRRLDRVLTDFKRNGSEFLNSRRFRSHKTLRQIHARAKQPMPRSVAELISMLHKKKQQIDEIELERVEVAAGHVQPISVSFSSAAQLAPVSTRPGMVFLSSDFRVPVSHDGKIHRMPTDANQLVKDFLAGLRVEFRSNSLQLYRGDKPVHQGTISDNGVNTTTLLNVREPYGLIGGSSPKPVYKNKKAPKNGIKQKIDQRRTENENRNKNKNVDASSPVGEPKDPMKSTCRVCNKTRNKHPNHQWCIPVCVVCGKGHLPRCNRADRPELNLKKQVGPSARTDAMNDDTDIVINVMDESEDDLSESSEDNESDDEIHRVTLAPIPAPAPKYDPVYRQSLYDFEVPTGKNIFNIPSMGRQRDISYIKEVVDVLHCLPKFFFWFATFWINLYFHLWYIGLYTFNEELYFNETAATYASASFWVELTIMPYLIGTTIKSFYQLIRILNPPEVFRPQPVHDDILDADTGEVLLRAVPVPETWFESQIASFNFVNCFHIVYILSHLSVITAAIFLAANLQHVAPQLVAIVLSYNFSFMKYRLLYNAMQYVRGAWHGWFSNKPSQLDDTCSKHLSLDHGFLPLNRIKPGTVLSDLPPEYEDIPLTELLQHEMLQPYLHFHNILVMRAYPPLFKFIFKILAFVGFLDDFDVRTYGPGNYIPIVGQMISVKFTNHTIDKRQLPVLDDTDGRADVMSMSDLKHRDPRLQYVDYAMGYGSNTVKWSELVSIEVLTQMLSSPSLFNINEDLSVADSKLELQYKNLHTVNIQRHLNLKDNVMINTKTLCKMMMRHKRNILASIPMALKDAAAL
jgi:hypothetical protein